MDKEQLNEDIETLRSEKTKLDEQRILLSGNERKLSSEQKKLSKEQRSISHDRNEIAKYHKQLSRTKDEMRLKEAVHECELMILRTEFLSIDKQKETKDVATWTVKTKSSEASTNTDDQECKVSSQSSSQSSDIQLRLAKLEEHLNMQQNMAYNVQQQCMPSVNASPVTVRTHQYQQQHYQSNYYPAYQHMYDPPCHALQF